MNIKRLIAVFFIISLFSTVVFSQDIEEETKKRNFINTTSFTLDLTPGFYLNPNSNTLVGQASSPIYPFALGFLWPNDKLLAISPSLSFFVMDHLFYEGTVYPAEIENRTSLTFNFIVNIPLVISLENKYGAFQITPGISILPRFAILARGLSESDTFYTGTAAGDIEEINKWFWQNARFLYLSLGTTYLINLSGTIKGGPTAHIFVPVGTIFAGESIQGMIISVGMKIQL